MNIAICDDEQAIRQQIQSLVLSQSPEAVVELYDSGEALLSSGGSFDILFLDIQMEGTNGIDVAKAWRSKGSDAVLIFITAVKEYVFEVFDVSAFHYLLKPIDQEKFVGVLKRAV